ncbi:MAG: NAD(P)/FAD-dependent oxidoreductase [Prevotella sp.]
MNEITTENLIIGGGPAGSACGISLRNAGKDCLIAERAKWPRSKLCAGVLTDKSRQCLTDLLGPIEYEKLMEASLKACEPRLKLWQRQHCFVDVDLSDKSCQPKFLQGTDCSIHEVDRPRFDQFLVNRFVELGGKLIDGDGVKDVSFADNTAVTSSGIIIHFRHLVAADGAYSHVEHLLHRFDPSFKTKRENSLALEINVSREDLDIQGINIYFGYVPHTYAWAFSKGDGVCLGICRIAGRMIDIRAAMREFCSDLGLRHPERYPYKGAQLPFGNAMRRPLWHDKVFFVGDAAGLDEPVTGEGIYYALQSGVDAASALVDNPRRYLESNDRLQQILRKSGRYQQLFNHRLSMYAFRKTATHHNNFVGFFYLTQIEHATTQSLPRIIKNYHSLR